MPESLAATDAVGAAPTISVIIVSYNTREMTLECLETLGARLPTGVATETFVVDNGSADGTVAAVRARFPTVTVVENPANTGFGAANNLAMARARGEYLLLLNSDAFPREDAIARLVECLRRHPAAGVVGPRLLNQDGTLQRSCYPFPSPATAWRENLGWGRRWPGRRGQGAPTPDDARWAHDTERSVAWVIGACLLVRRQVCAQVGGFDERFFMYQEEADWQKRIRAAGWQVVFTPAAEVVHLAGASGRDEPVRVNRHFFESLDKYMLKHHGTAGFLSVRAAMLAGGSLRAVGWAARALASPAGSDRRTRAVQRARFHAWLTGRQLSTGLPPGNGKERPA